MLMSFAATITYAAAGDALQYVAAYHGLEMHLASAVVSYVETGIQPESEPIIQIPKVQKLWTPGQAHAKSFRAN